MARRLALDTPLSPSERFENALIADETTATLAAALGLVHARLEAGEAVRGEDGIALRLAQQVSAAARAFHEGRVLTDGVWVGVGGRMH